MILSWIICCETRPHHCLSLTCCSNTVNQSNITRMCSCLSTSASFAFTASDSTVFDRSWHLTSVHTNTTSCTHGQYHHESLSWLSFVTIKLLRVNYRGYLHVLKYLLLLLLSASLYFSKRGAYWDRLCRDVVGCQRRALWPNGAS